MVGGKSILQKQSIAPRGVLGKAFLNSVKAIEAGAAKAEHAA
jgi:hypothetical protein